MFGISFEKFKNQDFVGIDLSTTSLKISHVRVSPPNKKEIISLVAENVTGVSDADIAKAISVRFHALKLKNAKIIDVLPSNLAITKNIEIPSVNPREIREIINLQAGRHTPYSREEIIVDYIDLGTYKRNYTKVLLVIVARSVVKRHFDIIEKAGVKLDRVGFAPEGFVRLSSRVFKLDAEPHPVSIIHIDDNFTDFSIAFKNKVLFVRSIPLGALHLKAEKEKSQTRFVEEIKKSFEAYQSEDIEKGTSSIVILGAVEDSQSLEVALADALHLQVKSLSYLKNLLLSAEALKNAASLASVSFLNSIAPIMSLDELKLDLVPQEIKLKKSFAERARDLVKTGIFSFIIFVLLFSLFISRIYFRGLYLKKLETKFALLDKDAKALEAKFSKIMLVKSYLSGRGFSLEILTELYKLVPLEMELVEIKFDGQGKLSIKGTAESMSVVFALVDSMEKSEFFADVKTKYTTKRKEGKKDVSDFEIIAQLEKGS